MTPTLNLINDSSCQMTAVHLSADTIKATSAFVKRVAETYPTQQAILFGSRARGTAH